MSRSERVCPKCGYEAGSRKTCPRCGGTIVDRSSLTPAVDGAPVPAAGKPAATKIRISKTTILIVVLVAVGLWLFYNWSTSAYSVDETKARNLIETLVREEMDRLICLRPSVPFHPQRQRFDGTNDGICPVLTPRSRRDPVTRSRHAD